MDLTAMGNAVKDVSSRKRGSAKDPATARRSFVKHAEVQIECLAVEIGRNSPRRTRRARRWNSTTFPVLHTGWKDGIKHFDL